jgi:hypothetical protein
MQSSGRFLDELITTVPTEGEKDRVSFAEIPLLARLS